MTVVIVVVGIAVIAALATVLVGRGRGESVQLAQVGAGKGDDAITDRERWQQSVEEIEFDRARGVLSDAEAIGLRAKADATLRAAEEGPVRPKRTPRAVDEAPGEPGGVIQKTSGAPPPQDKDALRDRSEHHHFVSGPAIPSAANSPMRPGTSAAMSQEAQLPSTDPAEVLVARMRATRASCPQCGPRTEPAARYCSTCGRYLRFCKDCGARPVEPGARYCSACGATLRAGD